MRQRYKYGKPLLPKSIQRFGNPFFVFLVVALILISLVVIVIIDLWLQNHNEQYPTSKTTIREAPSNIKFYSTPYFQFADSGNWKFAKKLSTSNVYIFQKFLGNSEVVQHQLIVYINHTPIPLYLASPRALPVNVKNGNSFDAKTVSQPCGELYKPGELHKVRTQSIDGTSILCDPDNTQFKVLFGDKGGNYQFKLKRQNGTYANYIIIYQDQRVSTNQNTALQIASTFQAL